MGWTWCTSYNNSFCSDTEAIKSLRNWELAKIDILFWQRITKTCIISLRIHAQADLRVFVVRIWHKQML